jgi:hypothetical protein
LLASPNPAEDKKPVKAFGFWIIDLSQLGAGAR